MAKYLCLSTFVTDGSEMSYHDKQNIAYKRELKGTAFATELAAEIGYLKKSI